VLAVALFALINLAALGVGSLVGWRLCRGLARAENKATFDGVPVVRLTIDPGAWPWSGARVLLLPFDTVGLSDQEIPR